MKPNEFPQRLKLLLDEHEFTQVDFAKRCGFEPSYINQLLNGHRYPSFENLLRIMEAFGDDPYSKQYLVGL